MDKPSYKLVPALVKNDSGWQCVGCVAERADGTYKSRLCEQLSEPTPHAKLCGGSMDAIAQIFILDTPEAHAEYIARRMCGSDFSTTKEPS